MEFNFLLINKHVSAFHIVKDRIREKAFRRLTETIAIKCTAHCY